MTIQINRREFIKYSSAALVTLITADKVFAEEKQLPKDTLPVKLGIIGLGQWGSETLAAASRIPSIQITAICDNYDPALAKAAKAVGLAAAYKDYRSLMDAKDVEAVIIATPSHRHKEISLAAIDARKHIYCEAPLATTLEDARAIANAGEKSKQVFTAGLQGRSNLLYKHVLQFVKEGCLGKTIQVYAQHNKKTSWRRMAPSPTRENELNWRLASENSPGLIGEMGIHSIDLASMYLAATPVAISGFGSVSCWDDGRRVPDTVQCVIEYPNNLKFVLSATIASSFGGSYVQFQGSDSTLMMQEDQSWMMREADSPLLGWEIYAHKEPVHGETGICMIADATKLLEQGKEPGKEGTLKPPKSALQCALEDFVHSIRKGSKPACGLAEAYKSTIIALKSNEAILTQGRIELRKEWFNLGDHNG